MKSQSFGCRVKTWAVLSGRFSKSSVNRSIYSILCLLMRYLLTVFGTFQALLKPPTVRFLDKPSSEFSRLELRFTLIIVVSFT